MLQAVRKAARFPTMLGALIAARGLQWGANRLRRVVQRSVSEDEAQRITRWWYDRAGTYKRDDWQHIGLHGFEHDVVQRCFPTPPARLLVLGCGGGREALALQQPGFTCVASDPSEALVQTAQRALGDGTIVRVGGIEDCGQHREDGPFDGVIVGWGAWGYVLRPQTRAAALAEIAALCPTGPVLLSWQMLQPPPVAARSEKKVVPPKWRGGDDGWRANLRVSPGRGIAVLMSREQVLDEASQHGFALVLDGTAGTSYPHVVVQRPTP